MKYLVSVEWQISDCRQLTVTVNLQKMRRDWREGTPTTLICWIIQVISHNCEQSWCTATELCLRFGFVRQNRTLYRTNESKGFALRCWSWNLTCRYIGSLICLNPWLVVSPLEWKLKGKTRDQSCMFRWHHSLHSCSTVQYTVKHNRLEIADVKYPGIGDCRYEV